MHRAEGEGAKEGQQPGRARPLGALVAALALITACRVGAPGHEVGDACVGEAAPLLAAPIYTFQGEPLNLDRDARERVDHWVGFFRDRRPDLFALFYRRAGRYEEAILEALRAEGLPEDFLYLALIESGMNPNAYSRAHAVGVWQFLESTGQMYGLEIGGLIDERRSPERSTAAAIVYLSDLHEQFGDWFLAAAAYNAGPGRVRRAMRRSGERDYWGLVRGGQLPRETAEYVPKLLAAAWLGAAPGLHGFGPLPRERPDTYDEVRLAGRHRLDVVARAAGTDLKSIRDLNPWLVGEATPPGGSTALRLPPGTAARFEEVYAWIPAHHRSGTLAHRVRPGETLGGIAREYGLPLSGLLALNPDVEARRLRPGQEIQVPPLGGPP